MDSFFSYTNIYRLVLKWKYHLAILVGGSAILAAVFSSSMFIKPLYKSTAVVYPSNIYPYSDESETEQMLQLLRSSGIRDSLILKFDLGKHWGLDPAEKYHQSTLLYLYGKRVSIKKTEFESVIIEVLDYDPNTACEMAKAVLYFYNREVRAMHKIKFHEVVVNYEQVLSQKQATLDSIRQAIDDLSAGRNLAVTVPDPALIRTFAEKAGDKKEEKKDDLGLARRIMAGPAGKDSRMVLLTSLAMSEAEAYSEFKLKYDEALLNYNREYTYSNVIVSPFVADRKAYPKTWFIVIFTSFAVLVLSLAVISFIENRKPSPSPAEKAV